jgi:nucleotide-binding universal stress UspA family protein
MKKILIALDYYPSAQKVAEQGYELAKSMNAAVYLLHVISDPSYYSTADYSPIMGFSGYVNNDPTQLDTIEILKRASLEFLEKTKLHLGDSAIQTLVYEGDVAEVIVQSVKKTHADILVMGSHSRKWFENIVLGSVSEEVLRHTTIPLYFIPTRRQG